MTVDDLHHADGTHRRTARTADGHGHDVERHEEALCRHTADGHTHKSLEAVIYGLSTGFWMILITIICLVILF